MKIFGKFDVDGKTVLGVLSVVVSLAGMAISSKSSEYEKQALKAEIKDDIVKDLKLMN